MSDDKREQLKAAGRIDENGNRVEVCPVCGKPGYVSPASAEGDAVAQPDAVVAGVTTDQ